MDLRGAGRAAPFAVRIRVRMRGLSGETAVVDERALPEPVAAPAATGDGRALAGFAEDLAPTSGS
ncbi:hypothetical protein [Kitasatospora sp. NPDC001527]|uniref:hypothetical protein n=1 Tax=Kitasatospora sp. NPDC001527 TaxID=3154519 RepID=UPI0033270425